jgi:hypothetical protein
MQTKLTGDYSDVYTARAVELNHLRGGGISRPTERSLQALIRLETAFRQSEQGEER